MRKFALALMAASAAVFGFGMVAQAQTGYDPVTTVVEPTPGGSYTVTYQNCVAGDTITFTQAQSTPVSGTAPCTAISGALTGSVVGLLLPQQTALGNATFTFTAAPTAPGTYSGTAVGLESPSQSFSFTLPGQAATTTTPVAPTTAPPVTTPGTGLPATGSDGIGTTTGIALGLLVVGFGLFVVAQVRRRQVPNVA